MARTTGYARVSTRLSKSRKRQYVDNQVQRLYDAGCEVVFTDEITGKDAHRPGWDKCLAYLEPGDTLEFTKLDRIGRSLHNLVRVVEDLDRRHVNLKSLDQGVIDTTSAAGKLLFGIMAAVAQFEADITASARSRAWTLPGSAMAAYCRSAAGPSRMEAGHCQAGTGRRGERCSGGAVAGHQPGIAVPASRRGRDSAGRGRVAGS